MEEIKGIVIFDHHDNRYRFKDFITKQDIEQGLFPEFTFVCEATVKFEPLEKCTQQT